MKSYPIGVHGASCALVADQHYAEIVSRLIHSAEHYCLCCLFIVDPDPLDDLELRVDRVLLDLASAVWRGVDARLLIGGSRENWRIRDATLVAHQRARQYGIDSRLMAPNTEQRSIHDKWLVVDDDVLLGSHNWSGGAFSGQVQDSVLVRNTDLAAYFVHRFEQRWPLAVGD